MKFDLGELETLFASIQDIIEFIEGTKYENRRFKLYLSNGEYLNFYIPKSSIPHLLGIDTSYLISTNIFKNTNSFELLKELVENPYKVYKLEKEGIINYNQLFSSFIVSKVNSFRENIKLNLQDIEFICKYDSEKTYTINDEFKNYNYILVKRLPNDTYGILCLVRNKGYYVPMSSQVFDDYGTLKDKLRELIMHQEITIVNSIEITNIINDYHNSNYLNMDDKRRKLQSLIGFKSEFGVSIDVANDFAHNIGKLQKNRNDKNETDILIDEIVESIRKGKFIDADYYENSPLLPIINAFNDFVCSNNLTADSENNQSYSSLISRLRIFEGKIKELETQNSELSSINSAQEKENQELLRENSELREKQEKIFELVKPKV